MWMIGWGIMFAGMFLMFGMFTLGEDIKKAVRIYVDAKKD